MSIKAFVDEIVAQGVAAAEVDYKDRPDDLEGAKQGFEACRDKDPRQLSELLTEARKREQECYTASILDKAKLPEFKKARAFTSEVHWVCNVLSAVMEDHKLQPIVPPTAKGVKMAEQILGAKPL
jgi:hypothetical protein